MALTGGSPTAAPHRTPQTGQRAGRSPDGISTTVTKTFPSACAAGDHLKAELGRVLNGGKTTLTDLMTATERLQADLVHSLLTDLRSDVAAIAEDAYKHQNGFIKIKLLRTEHFTVRLHAWPAGKDRPVETNPHGHRWEFASWIIAGDGLVERIYEPSSPAEPAARGYILYEYGSVGGTTSLREEGWAWLREQGAHVRTATSVYPCSRHVVHTVDPVGDEVVATLVLQGPRVAETAPVYAHPLFGPDERQRPVTVNETADLLDEVVHAMGVMTRSSA
jgi:hypothetical protein